MKLFQALELKGLDLKNRICVPPLVCFGWSDDGGMVSQKNIDHYQAIARGGAGLIIQEATCVSPRGRLTGSQLGIWSDDHIPGLKKIVDAVHAEGCPIFIQIHHAGVVGSEENPMLCPDDFSCEKNGMHKVGKAMTLEEIEEVQAQFVAAAKRAYAAGYDGIELHGCHSYLMSQFMNSNINHREDAYGKEPMKFVLEIYEGVRAVLPKAFIVGIRLGCFEPTLADGIAHAKALDAAGIDFLDISYGFTGQDVPEKPEDFPLKDVHYGAAEIKKHVKAPVFAVNGITSAQMAEEVLVATGVDMIDIGRGVLVNYNWAKDAQAGRDTGACLHCTSCMWRSDASKCPGRRLHDKKKEEK